MKTAFLSLTLLKARLTLIIICAVPFCAASSRAQDYSIDWHTIDGGGGTSTGGVYSVSGTIGQPDAGTINGGAYSLAGGFWGIVSAVQMPGAPLLTIRLTQTNTAIVSWPSPSAGFSLQQNSDLNTSNWNTPRESATDNGTNRFIIASPGRQSLLPAFQTVSWKTPLFRPRIIRKAVRRGVDRSNFSEGICRPNPHD
jgi:hypothetical protein